MANGIDLRYTPDPRLTVRSPGIRPVPGIGAPGGAVSGVPGAPAAPDVDAGRGDMEQFLREMAMRRERERQEDRARMEAEYQYMRGERERAQRQPPRRMGGQLAGGGDVARAQGARAAELDAARAGARARQASAEAMLRPAPMRMTTFTQPGVKNYYTMDPSAMTGAQRQVFLPQASQQQFSPGEVGSAETRAMGQRAFLGQMAQDRARGRRVGF